MPSLLLGSTALHLFSLGRSFLSLLLSSIVKMIADLRVCCGFCHRFCLSLLTPRSHAFLSLFLS